MKVGFYFYFFCFGFILTSPRGKVAFGILVPWPGTEPVPPAVEAQSPNHWTASNHCQWLLEENLKQNVFAGEKQAESSKWIPKPFLVPWSGSWRAGRSCWAVTLPVMHTGSLPISSGWPEYAYGWRRWLGACEETGILWAPPPHPGGSSARGRGWEEAWWSQPLSHGDVGWGCVSSLLVSPVCPVPGLDSE